VTLLGGLMLALIGSADLIRLTPRKSSSRSPQMLTSGVIVWGTIVVLAVLGLGVSWALMFIPFGVASLWVLTTRAGMHDRLFAGVAPALILAAALASFLIWDRTGENLRGFVVDWHSTAPLSVVRELALPGLVVGVGVVLFLMESANVLVRIALRSTHVEPSVESQPLAGSKRWWRTNVVRTQPLIIEDLRGGRLIGPLERLLILSLTVGGLLPIVVGLIAAKGIVRFPEISNDVVGGSKAEYFLVGSLVSWSLAFVGAGGVWLAANS